MARPIFVCPALASLAIFASTSSAQITVDGVQLQRTISGPAWNADKLAGKVVLIVLWSPKEKVSIGPMARAAKLDQDLGPYGLIVIGPCMQKMDDSIVEETAKKLGVKFSVTENIGVKGMNNQIKLPKSLLFGVDGKMLPEEPSDKAETHARNLLGAAIADRAKAKITGTSVQASIDNLRKAAPPATILSGLISRKSDPDAKALIESICFTAKEQFDDAKERLETDPVGVYNEVQRISTTFRGTPVGAEAGELFTKLKGDRLVQQELAARPSLEKVQKIDEMLEKAMKANPSKADPSSPEFTKAHSPQISQIRMIATQMRASWPKTRAASEASDIAMKYGVMFK